MRVKLKGIHTTYKTLATGERKKYYYAWKGGPRIDAEPGTPEFQKLFTEAAARKPDESDNMRGLIDYFKDADEYKTGSVEGRRAYDRYLKLIDAEFGDMPLGAIEDKRARGEFKKFRGKFSATPRKADYLWTTLARVLSVAKDHGKISVNVCEKGGRLYEADRAEIVWSADNIREFCGVASVELQAALLLALWTGQRQGDLLRLTWKNYDGQYIRLRQSKAKGGKGARVVIPVGKPLKFALDAAMKLERKAVTILTNSRGVPWTEDGFRTSWGKAFGKTTLEGLHFHDLRGTAVTRLALADCSVPQIAAITDHSMETVQQILDAHYLGGAAFEQYFWLQKMRGPVRGLSWGFVYLPEPQKIREPGPFADIRIALVTGIRYGDKPSRLKHAAEVWIGNIDEIHKDGKNPDNERAFKDAHANFQRAAENAPLPPLRPYTEIAAAFGLEPHRHQ